MRQLYLAVVCGLVLAGCANSSSKQVTDLNVSLGVAEAAVSAYAVQPSANTQMVTQLHALMTAAAAAVQTAQASRTASDAVAAEAAIAALAAYAAQTQGERAAPP